MNRTKRTHLAPLEKLFLFLDSEPETAVVQNPGRGKPQKGPPGGKRTLALLGGFFQFKRKPYPSDQSIMALMAPEGEIRALEEEIRYRPIEEVRRELREMGVNSGPLKESVKKLLSEAKNA